MSSRVVILGAGGHAKVVCDILHLAGYTVVGFLDDNPTLVGTQLMGHAVLGRCEQVTTLNIDAAIVGIGDNGARQALYDRLLAWGIPLVNAIHPSAVIARDVQVGQGVAMMAHVVVNTGSLIGNNVILNTGATVDHDCILADHVHLAPGVHLCGGVRVGRGSLVGVGASVNPYKAIGEGVIIGGGAAVHRDLPDGVTAVGVPARIIKRHQEGQTPGADDQASCSGRG